MQTVSCGHVSCHNGEIVPRKLSSRSFGIIIIVTFLPQSQKIHHPTPVTDQGSNPGSGERQLAVSDKALDHSAIRAGPQ